MEKNARIIKDLELEGQRDKEMLRSCLQEIIGPGKPYKSGMALIKATGMAHELLREAMLAGHYSVPRAVACLEPVLVSTGIWSKPEYQPSLERIKHKGSGI